MNFSKEGMTEEEIFEKLEYFISRDVDWESGKAFGMVFNAGKEYRDISRKAYSMFLFQNGLDFTQFDSLFQIERELVSMARSHLNGDENAVGNFTSGGTESIMLAVKAARDYCRKKKPGVTSPEMIVPVTGHAAFHKAADYLNIELVQVPVDTKSGKADPDEIEKAITENTILLVASAPSFSYGVVDPIGDIGRVATAHDLLFHVDACIGGFLLPYFKRLGQPVPGFDLGVEGVTSISMDLHKYAYAPPGASIILYKNGELRKNQIFACGSWTGYTIVNNTIQSTKSGGAMAAAWATLNYIGHDGYLEIARQKLATTQKLVHGINEMPHLRILYEPEMCLLAFTSDTVNVFMLVDEMKKRGWYIQPALSIDGLEEHIHLTMNIENTVHADEFLTDLEASVTHLKQSETGKDSGMLAQVLSDIDFSLLSDNDIAGLIDMAGLDEGSGPGGMAEINTILNQLPPELRERILVEYTNRLFR